MRTRLDGEGGRGGREALPGKKHLSYLSPRAGCSVTASVGVNSESEIVRVRRETAEAERSELFRSGRQSDRLVWKATSRCFRCD